MNKWTPGKLPEFLEKLRAFGDYPSVAGMVRAFGPDPSNATKWPTARGKTAPPALVKLLDDFAGRHAVDAVALRERWDIVPRAVREPGSGYSASPRLLTDVLERLRPDGAMSEFAGLSKGSQQLFLARRRQNDDALRKFIEFINYDLDTYLQQLTEEDAARKPGRQ